MIRSVHSRWFRMLMAATLMGAFAAPLTLPTPAHAWWRGGYGWRGPGWRGPGWRGPGWRGGWGWRGGVVVAPPVVVPPPVVYAPPPAVYVP